jgi:hypothetical protein
VDRDHLAGELKDQKEVNDRQKTQLEACDESRQGRIDLAADQTQREDDCDCGRHRLRAREGAQMNFFQEVIGLLSNPAFLKVLKVLLAYFAFAAAVDALPKPEAVSNPFAKWLLAFLHGLAGNLKNAAGAIKVPGLKENS